MTTATTEDCVQIFYEDSRPKSAQHYGWPLSPDDRENQKLFFGSAS